MDERQPMNALADINDFLTGAVKLDGSRSEEVEAPQLENQLEAAQPEPAEVDAAPEAPAESEAKKDESEDDKAYNFRRLRETAQEYKAQLTELERFKQEATVAFQQLYQQNLQLQEKLKSPKPAELNLSAEDDSQLSEVERAIRRQIREMNEPEIKRLQELRTAEEKRIEAMRAQELLSSASSTVDEIVSLGQVNLGHNEPVFKNFIKDLVLHAADKYNVDPRQARDAFHNAFEMYHQAKKAQEKGAAKAVVEQARKVSSPVSKVSAPTSESPAANKKIPSPKELTEKGYRGDLIDMVNQWHRDQLTKR